MIRIRSDDRKLPLSNGGMASRRTRAQRGATTLAVAVGVFAAGLAVAIAVPQVRNAMRKARATTIAEELGVFARAFELHAREHGDWPPATRAAGEIPAGMQSLPRAKWSQRSPGGFRYLWAPESLQRGQRYRAVIVLWRDDRAAVADERRLFEQIDRQVDDGDLLRGRFQLGYRDQPFFVLEP